MVQIHAPPWAIYETLMKTVSRMTECYERDILPLSVKVRCSRIRNTQSQTKWSDIGTVGGLSSFAMIQEQIQYLPCYCSKQLLWLNSPSGHIIHTFNSAWLGLFNACGPSELTLKQMIYEAKTLLNKLHYGPRIISTRTQTETTRSLTNKVSF